VISALGYVRAVVHHEREIGDPVPTARGPSLGADQGMPAPRTTDRANGRTHADQDLVVTDNRPVDLRKPEDALG